MALRRKFTKNKLAALIAVQDRPGSSSSELAQAIGLHKSVARRILLELSGVQLVESIIDKQHGHRRLWYRTSIALEDSGFSSIIAPT